MRDIDKEIYVKNVKKPIDYCHQPDESIEIVGVDSEEPVDAIDEEIQTMMESLFPMDLSGIDPDED